MLNSVARPLDNLHVHQGCLFLKADAKETVEKTVPVF